MIKLFVGKKGSGKTKLLIDKANEDVKNAKGNIVFIDKDNNYMLQVDYRARFINLEEYEIKDDIGLYGFICGVIASNYDVEAIYLDGLFKITGAELADLKDFFEKLDKLELKYDLNFNFSISAELDSLPNYMKKYKKIVAH